MRATRAALTAALGIVVCVSGCTSAPPAPQPRIIDVGEPLFDTQEVAWAYGHELHYGARTFDLGKPVKEFDVSDYGFFVSLADSDKPGASRHWFFFDGARSQPLGDHLTSVSTSADGRYAGWVDRRGDTAPAGDIASVVVVDLKTGGPIFATSEGMGGEEGDDLVDRYEELPPGFLGFDKGSKHAYWVNASGGGERMRWRLGTDHVEPAEAAGSEPPLVPVGDPVHAYRGSPGTGSDSPVTLGNPSFSPSGRYVADLSQTGRTQILDAQSGRQITVHFIAKAQYFAGWLPGDRFYVIGSKNPVTDDNVDRADLIPGAVEVCQLPQGTCVRGDRVPGMRDALTPGGASVLLWSTSEAMS